MNSTHQSHPNLIITILTSIIFLNLTIYLPNEGFIPFPAYLVDISIFLFLVGYYLKKRIIFPLGNILLLWVVFFLVLNIIYFTFSSMDILEIDILKVIIFATFTHIYLILLFNLDDYNLTMVRKTLIVIAPIATITLGIDYFNPGYFNISGELMTIQGRASSLYRNANYAASTMLVFLILGIDIIQKKYRNLFLLIIFLGIFFTMSRSNLMIFFLIVLIMFFQKKLYFKQIILSSSLIILFFVWLVTGGLDTLSEKYNLEITDNMKSRIAFFTDNKSSDTSDMNERKEILHDALEIFTDNPILGAGFGATVLWDHPVGPHNTFVMLWADQGLLGLLVIPLLFFCATYFIFKYGTKEQKQLAILFIISYTLSAFVSHNKLSNITSVAFVIAISAIGYKMKQKYLEV